jgi:TolB protein
VRHLLVASLLVVAASAPASAAAPVRNGRIALTGAPHRLARLFTMKSDGSDVRAVSGVPKGIVTSPDWSPDGKRIVFVLDTSPLTGKCCPNFPTSLYVVQPNGSGFRRLTPKGSFDETPAWSRDGTRIAFARARPDGSGGRLYVMDADGSRQRPLTAGVSGGEQDPTWSPDGRRVTFLAGEDIHVVDVASRRERSLLHGEVMASAPAWSPNGVWIAFVAGLDPWDSNLVLMRPDGTHRRTIARHVAHGTRPAWSPDGRSIVFRRGDDHVGALFVVPARGGAGKLLTSPALDADDPSWQPLPR